MDIRLIYVISIAFSLIGCTETPPPTGDPDYPTADTVFASFVEFYCTLPHVRATLTFHSDVGPASAYEFAAAKPNRLAVRLPPEVLEHVSFASDGEQLNWLLPIERRSANWTSEPALASFKEFMDHPSIMLLPSMGIEMRILIPLLTGQAADTFVKEADRIEYGGLITGDGLDSHRLRFVTSYPGVGELGMQLWIAQGDQPWLLRVVFENTDGGRDDVLHFSAWDASPPPKTAFNLPIPEWATRTDSLIPALPQAAHVSLGTTAPEFELPMLDTNRFSLTPGASHHVMILEFWASWCIPCMHSLPKVASLGSEYFERGVRFYAINVGESLDQAASTAKQRAFEFPIAVDELGVVSAAYGVRALPHTVVIDQTGVIRSVHQGAAADLIGSLRDDLEALLRESPDVPVAR